MTITSDEPNVANARGWTISSDSVGYRTTYRRGDAETYSTNTLEQHVTVTEAQQS